MISILTISSFQIRRKAPFIRGAQTGGSPAPTFYISLRGVRGTLRRSAWSGHFLQKTPVWFRLEFPPPWCEGCASKKRLGAVESDECDVACPISSPLMGEGRVGVSSRGSRRRRHGRKLCFRKPWRSHGTFFEM